MPGGEAWGGSARPRRLAIAVPVTRFTMVAMPGDLAGRRDGLATELPEEGPAGGIVVRGRRAHGAVGLGRRARSRRLSVAGRIGSQGRISR